VSVLNRPLRALAVVCIAAWLLPSCKPDYPKCKKDAHCAEKGEVCVEGLCRECGKDADCREGFTCRDGACLPQAECRLDADCGAGRRCRQGRCGPECGADADCAAGLKCRESRCVAGPECTKGADCGEGKICRDSRCVEAPPAETPAEPVEDAEARRLRELQNCTPQTVYFGFNEAALDDAARAALDRNAECARARNKGLTIEGHADERGTEEYNIVLGEKRANAVKRYLAGLGLAEALVKTVSFGEERPADEGHNDAAWMRNRRAESKFR